MDLVHPEQISAWILEGLKSQSWSKEILAKKSGLKLTDIKKIIDCSLVPNNEHLIRLAKAFESKLIVKKITDENREINRLHERVEKLEEVISFLHSERDRLIDLVELATEVGGLKDDERFNSPGVKRERDESKNDTTKRVSHKTSKKSERTRRKTTKEPVPCYGEVLYFNFNAEQDHANGDEIGVKNAN